MQSMIEKIEKIKLLILDVDGVLTQGNLYYSDTGTDMKAFSVLDGLGLKLLQNTGVQIGIITAHNSPLIQIRMQALKIQHVYQGYEHKVAAFDDLLKKLTLQPENVCYVGDDLPDIPLMHRAGFSITVPNARPIVKKEAAWISKAEGGKGAVREICEMIMRVQHTLDEQLLAYHQSGI